MEEHAGREIVMPRLYDWLVTGLNETNLPMSAAIAQSDFSLVDRQRLKNWQALFYEQIDRPRPACAGLRTGERLRQRQKENAKPLRHHRARPSEHRGTKPRAPERSSGMAEEIRHPRWRSDARLAGVVSHLLRTLSLLEWPRSPTFEEFRESIELLDQRTKSFAKQAAELIQELRRFPPRSPSIGCSSVITLAALAAGVPSGNTCCDALQRIHRGSICGGGILLAANLRAPVSQVMAGAFGLFTCYVLTLPPAALRKTIVRLGGLSWTREDFCRGWLITGDTGSGKTRSGITPLLYQIFKNEPGWGGVCIDDKGLYWETLCEMAAHFNRQSDLILLQVKPDNAPPSWKPLHTYNLTSDRSIPSSTYAKSSSIPRRVSASRATRDSSRTRPIPISRRRSTLSTKSAPT